MKEMPKPLWRSQQKASNLKTFDSLVMASGYVTGASIDRPQLD